MFKIKLNLNIKKYLTYVVFFIIFFSISSIAMILLKKRVEDQLGGYYAAKLLEKSSEEVVEQTEVKEPLRILKQLSPDEIKGFLVELRQRIDLYENKVALLDKKEKEIDSVKADIESHKKGTYIYERETGWGIVINK